MSDAHDDRGVSGEQAQGGGDGLRGRVQRQGEEALGRLAQEVLDSPVLHGAIAKAFGAREKAIAAQEAALGALNLPSAADVDRLTRRVRSVSQRLEGIEDGVDRLGDRLGALSANGLDTRLDRIEAALETLTGELAAIRKALPATPARRAAARTSGE